MREVKYERGVQQQQVGTAAAAAAAAAGETAENTAVFFQSKVVHRNSRRKPETFFVMNHTSRIDYIGCTAQGEIIPHASWWDSMANQCMWSKPTMYT